MKNIGLIWYRLNTISTSNLPTPLSSEIAAGSRSIFWPDTV
ncbi:hypothetical protein ASZ90_019585 [hydrocarbon metagenome]|uniref:Uncharacterized protein n=1 Tax=hydrocarbon metagenome TaxID=938273 RepID=A0A0W8E334_9ZZZZ